MGNCSSGDKADDWPKEKDVKKDPTLKWSYAARPRPPRPREKVKDPAHYQAKHLRGATFVRGPGSINGDQIQIEDCTDCDIFLCDEMDSVVVDDCTDCRLFLGPTSGSVFIRTSAGCKVVAACGQLRLRDCRDMAFSLYCGSKPVIESSKSITFCCFDGFYFNLREQMDACQLSAFNNRWSDVHDFTPKEPPNFSLGPPDWRLADLIKPLSAGLPDLISPQEAEGNGEVVVPRTWGLRRLPPEGEFGFALFLPNQLDLCLSTLKSLESEHPELLLTHTKESVLSVADARAIFAQSHLPTDARKSLLAGPSIAVGVFGTSAAATCQQLLSGKAGRYVAASPEEARFLNDQLFAKHQLGCDFHS